MVGLIAVGGKTQQVLRGAMQCGTGQEKYNKWGHRADKGHKFSVYATSTKNAISRGGWTHISTSLLFQNFWTRFFILEQKFFQIWECNSCSNSSNHRCKRNSAMLFMETPAIEKIKMTPIRGCFFTNFDPNPVQSPKKRRILPESTLALRSSGHLCQFPRSILSGTMVCSRNSVKLSKIKK